MCSMDIVLEVLKWAVIVLIAGFIGQFGKTMSLKVMDYLKKRRGKKISTESPDIRGAKTVATTAPETNGSGKPVAAPVKKQGEQKQRKAEKKLLKAQIKAKKKSEKLKSKG